MSGCFEDLYDYDLPKKCLNCGNISMKSNFHKNKYRKDCLQPHCISCRTQNYNQSREKTRKYYLENRDKFKIS